jgi:hypothetical protein
MKKFMSFSLMSAAFLGLCASLSAQALLIDRFVEQNPQGFSNWTNAGVVGDLSNAAVGSISGAANSSAAVSNITNLNFAESGAAGTFRGNNATFGGVRFPDNNLLNSYAFVNTTAAVYSMTLSGFVDGSGTPVTLTTPSNNTFVPFAAGNSFTLEANQLYRLYLFGVGYRNGQNSAFTFNNETKITNSGQVSVESDNTQDLHYVTFDFTTPSDLTGFMLSFTMQMTDWSVAPAGNAGAFNGLALVAIPEPSTFAFLGGLLALGMVVIRRRNRR